MAVPLFLDNTDIVRIDEERLNRKKSYDVLLRLIYQAAKGFRIQDNYAQPLKYAAVESDRVFCVHRRVGAPDAFTP